jgi:hypothetical protein
MTSLPWHVEKHIGRYELWPVDYGQTHAFVAVVLRGDDAEFIARAANSHADLLEVARMAASSIPVDPVALMEAARAAIKKCEVCS